VVRGGADPGGGAVSEELSGLLGDPRVIWTEDVLRFGDTDAIGHVNNSVFSVLCESGRVNLFRTRIDPTLPKGRYFVIAHLAIDFLAELHYPGRVRTGTWLTRLGRSSVALEQVIVSGEAIAARAKGVCVLMDRATRRPTPFGSETRKLAEGLVRNAEP
jgi:acyl-CoA thioester hydrolase